MKKQFWHIQMNQPENRGGIVYDSKKLLYHVPALIGTGDWDNYQCLNFKNNMNVGDILLVREGQTPIAICEILTNHFEDNWLSRLFTHELFKIVKVLEFLPTNYPKFPMSQGTLGILNNPETDSYKFIQTLHDKHFPKP